MLHFNVVLARHEFRTLTCKARPLLAYPSAGGVPSAGAPGELAARALVGALLDRSGAVDTSVASGSLAAGPLVVAVARSRSWVLGADDDDLIADIHKR